MNDYIIITDTTADLPYEIYKQLKIETVPMEFIMDEKVYYHYADAHEMEFVEFYRNIKEGKKASTTQINYYTYESVFTPVLESGRDILYISFSSGLSGTYQASTLIAADLMEKYPERKIISIDSLSASVGEGVLVYNAALQRKNGMSLEELSQWVKDNRLKACHWFVVDDLNHLKQGGRISAIQATLGTALNLKPLLSIDNEGKLIPLSKIRGSKKIMETFLTKVREDADFPTEQTVIIGHANNLEAARLLRNRLLEEALIKDAIISDIGPIIGTHVGEGMLALAFMGNRNLSPS